VNEELPTPDHPQFSPDELAELAREDGPPLTRRERRQRERALETGALKRVDGRLEIADPQPAAQVEKRAEEPPVVTSADVLAGKVSADSGLTRRQLRELAAMHEADAVDTGELESTVESEPLQEQPAEPEPEAGPSPAPLTPQRVSTKVVASELGERPEPRPESPAEQTARRPVVRPEGAQTGEYTGEFDQIRRAMADINAAPDTPPSAGGTETGDAAPAENATPRRRSIFEAAIPQGLSEAAAQSAASPVEDTDAADWTAVIDTPVVTDDLLPDLEPAEPAIAEPERAEPDEDDERVTGEPEPPDPTIPTPGDGSFDLPDWHTLTSLPAVGEPGGREAQEPRATQDERKGRTPMWLTLLQWIVIAVVAVVLGLLVWYAINRGFGSGSEDAAGIVSGHFPLLT